MTKVVIAGFVLFILSVWHISNKIGEVREQLWHIRKLMIRRWGQDIEREEVD